MKLHYTEKFLHALDATPPEIVKAFQKFGINAASNETTQEKEFKKKIDSWRW